MGRFAEQAEKWKLAPIIAGDEYWLPIGLCNSIESLEDFIDFLRFFAEGLSKDGFKTDIEYAWDLVGGLADVFQNNKSYATNSATYVDDDLVARPQEFKSDYAVIAAGLYELVASSNDRTD